MLRNRGFSFKDETEGGIVEVAPMLNSTVGGSDGRSERTWLSWRA